MKGEYQIPGSIPVPYRMSIGKYRHSNKRIFLYVFSGSITRHARIHIRFGSTDDIIISSVPVQVGQCYLSCFCIIFQADRSIRLQIGQHNLPFFRCNRLLSFDNSFHPIDGLCMRSGVHKVTSTGNGLFRQAYKPFRPPHDIHGKPWREHPMPANAS